MGDGNPALIVMVQEDERRKQWQFNIRDIFFYILFNLLLKRKLIVLGLI